MLDLPVISKGLVVIWLVTITTLLRNVQTSTALYCSEKSMEMPTSAAYYDITVLSKVSLPNLPNKLPLSFIAPSYLR